MPSFNPEVVGYLAGGMTTISFVPQVIKTWRTKSTEDLSMGMLLTFSSGVMLWFAYGLAVSSRPMILWNALTFVQSAFLVVMKLRDRRW
jgi:MtN3 and saliva related transmembrane protein